METAPLNPYLRTNLLPRAIGALDARLTAGQREATFLRPHQWDTLQAIHETLAQGQTTFYIPEATGSGKTAIALDIANTIMSELAFDNAGQQGTQHGVAIYVSPTIDLLTQTRGEAERFAPGLSISNYYGDEKDATGTLINTTYNSLPQLLDLLERQARNVRLLIADELHTGLGNVRHTVYRRPELETAIMMGLTATPYFDQLEALIERGRVDENERWVGMFRNEVHPISVSDGIDQGILAPVDIRMFATGRTANVSIRGGDYDSEQLETFLQDEPRNYMTIAMIVGSSYPVGTSSDTFCK